MFVDFAEKKWENCVMGKVSQQKWYKKNYERILRKNREHYAKRKKENSESYKSERRRHKEYYAKNKEKLLKQVKEYGFKNREKKRAVTREWYKKNRERASKRDKEKRLKHGDKIRARARFRRSQNPEYHRLKGREWRNRNLERARATQKKSREKHVKAIALRHKRWVQANRDKVRAYWKKYYSTPEGKIQRSLRGRLRAAVKKQGAKKFKTTFKLVGCSLQTLMKYLESKFKPGMSWENYGLLTWHIDHIKPVSKFNLLDPIEQRKCFHYTNLQPLWAKENIKKSARY